MTIISISLILLVLIVLLLNLGLASRWHWSIKLLVIIIALLAVVLSYNGLQGLLGYPTTDPLPEQARVVAIDIQEPDKRTQSDGYVFVWVKAANDRLAVPRAYRLPYSDKLKSRASKAARRLTQGRKTGIRQKNNENNKAARLTGTGAAEIEFYKLSSAKLPPKK